MWGWRRHQSGAFSAPPAGYDLAWVAPVAIPKGMQADGQMQLNKAWLCNAPGAQIRASGQSVQVQDVGEFLSLYLRLPTKFLRGLHLDHMIELEFHTPPPRLTGARLWLRAGVQTQHIDTTMPHHTDITVQRFRFDLHHSRIQTGAMTALGAELFCDLSVGQFSLPSLTCLRRPRPIL